jgi:hypothetical protein
MSNNILVEKDTTNKIINFKILDFGESCDMSQQTPRGRFCYHDSSQHYQKCAILDSETKKECLKKKRFGTCTWFVVNK